MKSWLKISQERRKYGKKEIQRDTPKRGRVHLSRVVKKNLGDLPSMSYYKHVQYWLIHWSLCSCSPPMTPTKVLVRIYDRGANWSVSVAAPAWVRTLTVNLSHGAGERHGPLPLSLLTWSFIVGFSVAFNRKAVALIRAGELAADLLRVRHDFRMCPWGLWGRNLLLREPGEVQTSKHTLKRKENSVL